MNFKLKTLLYFMIVAIFPFAISMGLFYISFNNRLQQDYRDLNYTSVQNVMNKMNYVFSEQEEKLEIIAEAYSYIDQSSSSIQSFLSRQIEIDKYFLSIYIIMNDGTVYHSDKDAELPRIDFTKFYGYVYARKNQGTLWMEPYTDAISNTKCIGVSRPVYDSQGNECGVLVGNIPLESFSYVLEGAKYMNGVELYLINSSGFIKYDHSGKYSDSVNISDSDFILKPLSNKIMEKNDGYQEFRSNGKGWICTYNIINSNGWKIVSLVEENTFFQNLRSVYKRMYSLTLGHGVLCIILAIGFSMIMSSTISEPLIKLRNGAKAISEGNLDSRIEVNSNDEISEVAETFNDMAGNLKNTYTDLLKRTDELSLNNEELQSMNIELEASYEQLAATASQLNESDSQLRKKYNELQTLNRISNTLASTMDLKNMLIAVVNQVADITEALVCTIRLISDKDPYKLELKALKGVWTEEYDRSNIDIREGIISQAVEKKSTVVIELQEGNIPNRYYEVLYKENGAGCMVFTPIVVKSKVIGIMATTLGEKPKDEMIELISSLSNNIAIAIDNAKAYDTLKQSYLKTVQSLVSVVEAKDEYTESHSIRVAKYSAFIASEMKYSKSFVEDIWVAGVLHDIGKIGIDDSILNKDGPLTDDEYNTIKQHPGIAYKIVSKIGLSEDILKAIKHHHERFDGRGYPDRIKGDEISIMASIISVADAFDAITSNRPYRKSRSIMQGINEVLANRGTQFNPIVVETVEKMYLLKQDVFEKIYNDEEIEFF